MLLMPAVYRMLNMVGAHLTHKHRAMPVRMTYQMETLVDFQCWWSCVCVKRSSNTTLKLHFCQTQLHAPFFVVR